jgi:hypothetical protein
MFGQSFLARLAVTKALNMLGVPEDVAKCAGWVVGVGSMVLTLDTVGAGAELTTAVGAEVAGSLSAEPVAKLESEVASRQNLPIADDPSKPAEGMGKSQTSLDGRGISEKGNVVRRSRPAQRCRSIASVGPTSSPDTKEFRRPLVDLAWDDMSQDREPNHSRILFLSSEAEGGSRSRSGIESREIREKLRLGRYRNSFALYERYSVRPSDISESLLDINPEIVHFAGSSDDRGFCCENAGGQLQSLAPAGLAALFEMFAGEIKCILLNVGFSEIQARAIAKYIDYVIGTSRTVDDRFPVAFAGGFYQALAAGRPIPEAYRFGCVQVGLQGIRETVVPVLFQRA